MSIKSLLVWSSVVVLFSTVVVEGGAAACSAAGPPPAFALPRPGATAVPTATSVVIVMTGQPVLPHLTAGGVEEPIDGVERMGQGILGETFWRVRVLAQMLQPDVEYVLTTGNPAVELTRFTTGPGYDKDVGTAPTITALQLWRVRFPVSEIGSGNCVFSEYEGYMNLQYQPGVVPGTPADSTITTVKVKAKNGGPSSSVMFTGAPTFNDTVADGVHPAPGAWHPYLDPSFEYCVEVVSNGYGDLARLPLASGSTCTTVQQVASPGATLDVVDGGGGGGGGGGGCNTSGSGPAGLVPLLGIALALSRRRR